MCVYESRGEARLREDREWTQDPLSPSSPACCVMFQQKRVFSQFSQGISGPFIVHERQVARKSQSSTRSRYRAPQGVGSGGFLRSPWPFRLNAEFKLSGMPLHASAISLGKPGSIFFLPSLYLGMLRGQCHSLHSDLQLIRLSRGQSPLDQCRVRVLRCGFGLVLV